MLGVARRMVLYMTCHCVSKRVVLCALLRCVACCACAYAIGVLVVVRAVCCVFGVCCRILSCCVCCVMLCCCCVVRCMRRMHFMCHVLVYDVVCCCVR